MVKYEEGDELKKKLYQIFGMPFNVTSGYCHKPNITVQKDVVDQNSNDIDPLLSSEKGKSYIEV